ncbi:uncharacterized protein [Rutidosis leptorrhynchoides]|uniref:uncharacterized protein n=1 Tax=Rutidosis leptorrhynchoides TaxID=125765 RepID=UPI003A99B422
MLTHRRSKQPVLGISLNGVWVTESAIIKNAFKQFYSVKFTAVSNSLRSVLTVGSRLPDADNELLQIDVTEEVIRIVVWDCGNDKYPGLDGYMFLFIKRFWDSFKGDLVTSIKTAFSENQTGKANQLAHVIDKVISHEQTDFIKGRQILYGLLIISELDYIFIKRKAGSEADSWGESWEFKMDELQIDSCVQQMGCSKGVFPFTYLGLPIGVNMNTIANQKPLEDGFLKKLPGWNAKLLLIGGRLTLKKAVLGSLGVYYLSIFKCPEMTLDKLESLRAGFFWGSTENDKKKCIGFLGIKC